MTLLADLPDILNTLTNLPMWVRYALVALFFGAAAVKQGWINLPNWKFPTPTPDDQEVLPKTSYRVPDNDTNETDLYLALRLLNEEDQAVSERYLSALHDLNTYFMNRRSDDIEEEEEYEEETE